MDLSDLYSDRILQLAANAPQPGRLASAHASARKVSRLCGSSIEVDVAVEGGVITGYGQALSACALGQAAAAVVAREIVGTPVAEFTNVRAQMVAMLKSQSDPPQGRWSDLALLQAVRGYPARHSSTLLVFDAVVEALEKAESHPAVKADR